MSNIPVDSSIMPQDIPSQPDSASGAASGGAAAPPRFQQAQVNRSLVHPTLPQPSMPEAHHDASIEPTTLVPLVASATTATTTVCDGDSNDIAATTIFMSSHSFVVAADTQFGMTAENANCDVERAYSQRAVQAINALSPRPLYCCICGDLVDMVANIYAQKAQLDEQGRPTSATTSTSSWTVQECDKLQEEQYADMQSVWLDLHPDIALVCLCGNHDVGNRPNQATIQRFTQRFGNDYLAFWANGTYNIIVNSALFSDPSDAHDLYEDQLQWLTQRLQYANDARARHIFVYSHHPWFLYDDAEDATTDLTGTSPLPGSNGQERSVPDSYFPIPMPYRQVALDLMRRYNVSAAFAGHFHQNVVSTSSFGMQMIITGSLSMVLDSTGNPNAQNEAKTQGFRIVHVQHHDTNTDDDATSSRGTGASSKSTFHHRFVALPPE